MDALGKKIKCIIYNSFATINLKKMNKIKVIKMESINGGGARCDFASGLMVGWGAAGVFAGGVAASTGVGLVVFGIAAAIYCAS